MFLGDFRPSDRRTISAFLTWANSYDERAGQLDSASFFGKRNVGETPYLNNDGHLRMESVRVGVTHSYRINERFENAVTGFFSGVSREDVFAVGLNPRSNQTFGARAVMNARFQPNGRALTGVTGVDFEQTNQFAKGYPYNNKVQGGITTDLETRTMQYSAFSQWDLALPSAFTLTAGASLNFIEYGLTDRLTNSANPTHRDLTGRKVYDPVLMPRVALLRMFGNDRSVYVSFSQGFTPATSNDAVIPFTGQPNEGLKPERANQIEVGTKGSFMDRRLSYQLAMFNLMVHDKLTSQSVFNNAGTQLYAYTVNAGEQSNRGAELAMSYSALRSPIGVVSSFRPFLSYAYSDFTYSDFKSNNNNNAGTVSYDGKSVAGVPKQVFTVGADAAFSGGVYANATAEHRGTMPLTYDNVHEAPAYTLVNARAGVRRALGVHLEADAFIGAQNLTNALYYTMAFLNGNYSGASPAVFLPGPYTSRMYGGLTMSIRP
jgi:iron complex outermembrane receptor protein